MLVRPARYTAHRLSELRRRFTRRYYGANLRHESGLVLTVTGRLVFAERSEQIDNFARGLPYLIHAHAID